MPSNDVQKDIIINDVVEPSQSRLYYPEENGSSIITPIAQRRFGGGVKFNISSYLPENNEA